MIFMQRIICIIKTTSVCLCAPIETYTRSVPHDITWFYMIVFVYVFLFSQTGAGSETVIVRLDKFIGKTLESHTSSVNGTIIKQNLGNYLAF